MAISIVQRAQKSSPIFFTHTLNSNIIGSLTQTEWEKMMLECSFALHPPDEKGKNVYASDALVDSSENIISLLFFEHTISLLI